MKVLLQQPTDQSIGQRMGESHLPGQYLDIALILGQYLDNYIAQAWLQGNVRYIGLQRLLICPHRV